MFAYYWLYGYQIMSARCFSNSKDSKPDKAQSCIVINLTSDMNATYIL